MHINTKGIVLRETEYNDADLLLTVLTRDLGLVTLKARGARRSRCQWKSACQLLAYSAFTVFGYRERFTIDEAEPVEQFLALRGNIELLSLGMYFAQAAELLSQEDCPNPALLSLLLNSLYTLCQGQKPQLQVKAAFELKAACLAGFAPALSGCAFCGAPEPDRFNLTQGVLQCHGCGTQAKGLQLPVGPGTLAAMRHIAWGEDKRLFAFRLGEASLKELGGLTEAFLITQLEHSFPTLDFYKSLFLGEI